MQLTASLGYVIGIATVVAAATHEIKVGNDLKTLQGLRFSPNVTTAAVGDTVVFHFWPGHHDVVQGDYNNACNPSKDGFFSGFISPSGSSGEADKIFTVTINNTDPIWFYCSEVEHCQNGMVGVINPPATGDSLSGYESAAAKTSNSTTPATVQGGVVSPNTNSTSSPSSSSASATGPTSTSSSPASTSSTGAAADIASKNKGLGFVVGGMAVAICWAGLM